MLTRKSSKSSTEPPGSLRPLNTLKPSTQGMESTMMAMRFTTTAFVRLQPVRSMAKERIFSNTAMIVEKAAKDMKRKKRLPQSRPPFMVLNTLGRVIKIRLGPLSGWMS